MASISTDAKGNRMIQFTAPDRSGRRTIRLGKVPLKDAQSVKCRIEALVSAKALGQPIDLKTIEWLDTIGPALAEKIEKVGLIPKRSRPPATLGDFIDFYIAQRTDVEKNTLIVWRQTRRCLVKFFGPTMAVQEISRGDADAWRSWLSKQSKNDRDGNEALSENTVARRCGFARQFFRSAVDHRLIQENPFDHQKDTKVRGNPQKFYFVTSEDSAAIIDACPDAEWQLIFALCRWGGLRCPSEHLALTWGDIVFDRGRMIVHAPKTKRHKGKEKRIVPIFPELRPYLEAVFNEHETAAGRTPTTDAPVINRKSNSNLRTQFMRIIRRAGLKPWPRIFHNLRATRQNELEAEHPSHVVCAWIGNSEKIAREFYLHPTEAEFEKALHKARQHQAIPTRREANEAREARGAGPARPGVVK
ncbi:MAG: tyrosine-type recombinase/integrase [Planctomycetaceae bacterium]